MFLDLPSEFWAALMGSALGIFATIAGVIIEHYLRNRSKYQLDKSRQKVLKQLLDGKLVWRDIDTLSRVIGADKENTRRLLFELCARGSEASGRKEVWALISRAPLPVTDKAA